MAESEVVPPVEAFALRVHVIPVERGFENTVPIRICRQNTTYEATNFLLVTADKSPVVRCQQVIIEGDERHFGTLPPVILYPVIVADPFPQSDFDGGAQGFTHGVSAGQRRCEGNHIRLKRQCQVTDAFEKDIVAHRLMNRVDGKSILPTTLQPVKPGIREVAAGNLRIVFF